MISACSKANQWALVKGLIETMREEGLPIQAGTFDAVLDGDLPVSAAVATLDQMRQLGVLPR